MWEQRKGKEKYKKEEDPEQLARISRDYRERFFKLVSLCKYVDPVGG